MKENKALSVTLLVLKIICAAVLILSFAYYAFLLIDAYVESVNTVPPESGVYIEPFPVAFVLVLIFSLITSGVSFLLSLVGLLISVFYRTSEKRKKNVISFVILLIAPILFELLLLSVRLFVNL